MEHKPDPILPQDWANEDFGEDPFLDTPGEPCLCGKNRLVTQDEVTFGMCNSCLIAEEYTFYTRPRRERGEAVRRLAEEINALSDLLPPALIRAVIIEALAFFTNGYDLYADAPPCVQEVALAKESATLDKIVCLMERVGTYLQTDNADGWLTACYHFVNVFRTELGEDVLERW